MGSEMMTEIVGIGREQVSLVLEAQGRDLVLHITGGEAHVGAVALADPRETGPAPTLVLPPHKEGPLAAEAAAAVARASGRVCAVAAGIHQEAVTPAEIAGILANVREGVARLCAALKA